MEKSCIIELCELIIELLNNQNAAGEYDGDDPRLKDKIEADIILPLAYKIKQEEEMRI